MELEAEVGGVLKAEFTANVATNEIEPKLTYFQLLVVSQWLKKAETHHQ